MNSSFSCQGQCDSEKTNSRISIVDDDRFEHLLGRLTVDIGYRVIVHALGRLSYVISSSDNIYLTRTLATTVPMSSTQIPFPLCVYFTRPYFFLPLPLVLA